MNGEASLESAPSEVDVTSTAPSKGAAWSISFASAPNASRAGKKEREAALASRLQRSRMSPTEAPEAGSRVSDTEGEDGGVTGTSRATVHCPDGSTVIDLAVAIPRGITTTREQMAARNYIDHQQMLCMVRQYKASCGVSSLTSVWNRLYSILGSGSLPPVSQEEVMTILGFEPPFETIRWGPFTGNVTLIRWFHVLNNHFGVRGKASFLYKVHGQGRTMHVRDSAEAKTLLYEAIQNPQCGVIYHCLNHYMVPMGFIDSPRSQLDVYAPVLSDPESFIVIGEVSRGKHPPMHIKKWDDIATDLNCSSPQFFNIRQSELGVQTKENCKSFGRNIHCLMSFRSDIVEEDVEGFLATCEGGDDGDANPTAGDAL